MRTLRVILIAASLACGAIGCERLQPPSDKMVAVPADWRTVDLGLYSFSFPSNRKLYGHDNLCGLQTDVPGCLYFDEGRVLTYNEAGFTVRTRDSYGDTGPSFEELGTLLIVNGRKVYRAKAPDGSFLYTVTVESAGPGAARRFGLQRMDALLWLRCRSLASRMAEAIAGSVKFATI